MFIAIIVAHYNQFKRESEDKDEKSVSFFKVIFNILKHNMFADIDKNDPKLSRLQKLQLKFKDWVFNRK